MTESTKNSTRPRRRWLQFTLRTLLLTVFAAAVGLAWLGNGMQRARKQRETVVQLERESFGVLYDYEYDENGNHDTSAEPTSPDWLRSLLGHDFFHDVVEVYVLVVGDEDLDRLAIVRDLPTFSRLRVRFQLLPGPAFRDVSELDVLREVGSLSFASGTQTPTDEDLRHLRTFDNVENLYLNALVNSLNGGPVLSDVGISYMKGFKTLKNLDLSFNNITDAGLIHLRGLTNLESLDLTGTHTTDAGLVHLERLVKLRYLHLSHINITDAGLVHLQGLTNLESLRLTRTHTSDAGLVHFEQLVKLRYLYLNHITDRGLGRLKHFEALERLYLYECPGVTDEGLSHLKRLPSLTYVRLGSTSVTAEGAAQLKKDVKQLTID